jgi:hypothetical protein
MTQQASRKRAVLRSTLAAGSSIKVVGLGGVGGIVARYLSMFLASLDIELRLVLIDGDAFEPSNASRMFFGACGNKAAVTRRELLPRFQDSQLSLDAIEEYLTRDNIGRLIHPGDVVILAVDNHATRKLVSDFCAGLDTVTLISGGNDGIEEEGDGPVRRGTFGNVQVFRRDAGVDVSPSLTRFHPEIAQPADKNPAEASCTELVVSVPQILFANLTVASAILNSFWLHCCEELGYAELVFDIAEGLMRPTIGMDGRPLFGRAPGSLK